LAFVFLIMFYVLREQARLREIYIDAHVVLIAGGYQESSGVPTDREMAQAYARREFTTSEAKTLLKLTGGWARYTMGISLVVSGIGFGLWWRRVQRYEDAILMTTAARIQREESAAAKVMG